MRGAREYVKHHKLQYSNIPTYNFNMDSIYRLEDLRFLRSEINGIVQLDKSMIQKCNEISELLEDCLKQPSTATEDTAGRQVALPVFYSPEVGPDLLSLAKAKDLSPDDVIRLHHEHEYRVYAIGFAPGFAYLGQVNEQLATARLATPRAKVPRGAVGIADQQTAVYPSESPGGWNLIGRCPIRMFDPNVMDASKVNVGDRVRFEPIDRETFLEFGGEL